jgi:SAM-dependent methyltransferase
MIASDFTGERFVPGQGGAQIAYEHLHRYNFALRWAAERDVLDVAAGIGYGAALLGKAARRVWAIDIDAACIQHARRTCGRANLEFLQGDATCLPVRARSMDLVVALEVLEHVERQEALIAELARVVRPGGAVLISTPDKASYSDARHYQNPFHVHELYLEEFLTLLGGHFSFIRLFHQQVRAGSLILAEDAVSSEAEIIARPALDALPLEPMYLLALCGVDKPAVAVPGASACLDTGDALFREWVQELDRLNTWCQDTLAIRDQAIRGLQKDMEREIPARDEIIRQLQGEVEDRTRWAEKLGSEINNRDQAVARLQSEFEERTRWALELEGEVAARDDRLKRTNEELDRVSAHLAQIRHALLYRILCRLGVLPK